MRAIAGAILLGVIATTSAAAQQAGEQTGGSAQPEERIDLVVQPDEAEAVLAILEARAAGAAVPEAAWERLRAAEGYRRMIEREQWADRTFGRNSGYGDERFRRWAESDAALEGLAERRQGLNAWLEVDIEVPAAMAMNYLPSAARLRGTIYPIIRDWNNSFIYELDGPNPGIFMYVEPGLDARGLEHILAHEFHHMGLISGCAGVERDEAPVLRVLQGFAEGLAVLAAAGGPDGETHQIAAWSDVRDNWGRRLDSLAVDMAEMDAFLVQVVDGAIQAEDLGRRLMHFSSRDGVPQGPFYSVGWHMATTVERDLGRQTLLDDMCHYERLLLNYDEAAAILLERDPAAELPRWSPALLARLRSLDDAGSDR